jgi:hypothetical protein
MRNFFKLTAIGRAAAPILIACLLVFQGGLAGLANGAAGSGSGLIAQICASGKTNSDDPSKSIPHHGGACCILHHNIIAEPDVDPASIVVLARVAEATQPWPQYRIDAVASAPELASSAPRGPPTQIV